MTGQKKLVKKTNKYADDFKRKVAQEYLSGKFSYGAGAELYALSSRAVVKEFVRWYRKRAYLEEEAPLQMEQSNAQAPDDQSDLRKQVQELEKQLALAKLKIEGLETLIDVAEAQFQIPIRKKSGTKQSCE